ncbi:MAG: hypothetical protein RIR18_518 [Pseudomonadota bacterium]|jgi:diguanylate cyclase (GGDEF)-like protein/PAS domain S-box-containing protein
MDIDEPLAKARSTILVVDDSPIVLKTIAGVLRTMDVDVREACGGEAALGLSLVAPLPDLILLDVMMPDINGYEVLKRLRLMPQTVDIPVIFVTALDEAVNEEIGIQLGAVDYLAKPIKAAVLRARVQAQLDLYKYKRSLEQTNLSLLTEVQLIEGAKSSLEQRLSKVSEFARLSGAVLAGISDGVCVTDTSGAVLFVNRAFAKTTGYTEEQIVGQNPRVLKSGVHPPSFYQEMWKQIQLHDNWQGEITNRLQNGSLVTEWLSISAIRNPQGGITHYVGIFSGLSERKNAASRIEYLAAYDPLTDLPNRNLFADRLSQCLLTAHRYHRQTTVLLLDLDRFRSINDQFGPAIGDKILVEVARRLKLQIRDGDTIGRRGGNEFGFVLANIAHERDAIMLAQRMLEALAEPFKFNGKSISISAGIGISIAPVDGDVSDNILMQADMALARAKTAGKNAFRFFSPDMDVTALRRMSLETELHNALLNNELFVVYQPQISLHSGNITGMEAMLRWRHPKFGLVSPHEFIPIAEDTGLIIPMGDWVLDTACRQTKKWLDLGLLDLRVAVNLTTKQFCREGLAQVVSDTLLATGLPPAALELEITERSFIDDVDFAISQSKALKRLGIKLSLDDFGTGYSSLAYLSRFPFDKLKIDQGFVKDITENPVNAAIANAAIVLARSLNLSVLAEGVETEAQAQFLRGRRCDSMQGYFYSRPVTVEGFEQLLVEKRFLNLGAAHANGDTLLLIDDEPNVISALHRLFRREGYTILAANSPKDAFEILARNSVNVILADQRLPDMAGTEFFLKVGNLYPETVRIILTGYTDIALINEAVENGTVDKFLTKPWDDDELREQIRDAFRHVNGQKKFGGLNG